MAKAAATEPSMDDILSSIRQIISDDDTGENGDEVNEAEMPVEAEKDKIDHVEEVADFEVEKAEVKQAEVEQVEVMQDEAQDEALELTSEQIVEDVAEDDISAASLDIPEMVVPDDISFDETEMQPEPVEPEEIESQKNLPDPDLSSDIAEKLLEPATDAAVSSAFAQLGAMGFSDKDLTIENMIREMLRPMLKTWLDENLPSVVETMVRKEIERLSRGA